MAIYNAIYLIVSLAIIWIWRSLVGHLTKVPMMITDSYSDHIKSRQALAGREAPFLELRSMSGKRIIQGRGRGRRHFFCLSCTYSSAALKADVIIVNFPVF